MASDPPGRSPLSVDQELDRHARGLLAQASVLAEAPAGQTNQIGRQHPSSVPPPARGTASFDDFKARYRTARIAGELLEFCEWAEDELRLIRQGPDREPETLDERNRRIISEYEGKPAQHTADKEHLSLTLIRKIRQQAGRDPRTGRAISARAAES